MKRRILVTSALPYANGPIHLGHLVETVQADIWVRFQQLRGHECIYVCADDAHGTPVMLRAESEGVTPVELIDRLRSEHQRDFEAFGIGFSHYHSTHSDENRFFTEQFYERLRDDGHTVHRDVVQFYDEAREIFLPDRFVKGTCPRCGTEDQNGDSCDSCGSTYEPRDLVDPRSVVTGTVPTERSSEHIFIRLSDFEGVLRRWVTEERLQSEVVNKLEEWFAEGLKDWDISRDEPYFGFEIPDAPGKYFYVWLDAPIGYMASFRAYCDGHDLDFDDWWGPESDTELYHFIGKDILYFHCLFWPAMLYGAGYRMPTAVFVHGFLNAEGGEKMSKSKGTFVDAATYLDHLDPELLRYYIAARLGSGLADFDFSREDFERRVNSDLVGKIVNIASRSAGLLHKHLAGRLGPALDTPEVYEAAVGASEEIAEHFENRELSRAVRRIVALADDANRYIAEREPWKIAKEDGGRDELQAVLTTSLNLFRLLMIYLSPILPSTTGRAAALFGADGFSWQDLSQPLVDADVAPYEALLVRVDPTALEAMFEATRADAAAGSC